MWIPQIILYLIYSTQAFTKQYIFVPTGGHLVSSETSRQHWEMDIPTSCTLPGHQAGHPPWELEKERQLSQGIFKTFCFLLRVSFSNNFCQFSLLPWKTVMLCVWKVQPLWFKILADSQNNCLRRENKGKRNTHSIHNFLFNSSKGSILPGTEEFKEKTQFLQQLWQNAPIVQAHMRANNFWSIITKTADCLSLTDLLVVDKIMNTNSEREILKSLLNLHVVYHISWSTIIKQ